jgi:NOL1/NOP2/fmu family ribosome biogenesis protein
LRSGNKEYSEHKLSKEDRTAANKWTGFPDENLIKSGNEIISVAGSYNDYILLEKHLRIIKPGTRILTIKSGDLLPSHELAMSVIFRPESFPSVIVTPEIALNYLHRDTIRLKEAQKGWNILTYCDVPLGFINNIGTRVNNYYPVEWRIRMNISDATTGSLIKWQNE